MEVVCVEVTIDQAMIQLPLSNLKDRMFYVEVQTEDEIFQTGLAKGANPRWKHKQSITTRSGTLYFRLFEKGSFMRYVHDLSFETN